MLSDATSVERRGAHQLVPRRMRLYLTDEEIRQAWAAEAIKRRNEVRGGLVQTIPEDVVAKRVRDLVHK